jgi:tetratricopeptide (TPR) repeat protein
LSVSTVLPFATFDVKDCLCRDRKADEADSETGPVTMTALAELHENAMRFANEAKYESAISCFEEMKKMAILSRDERSEALSFHGLGITYNLQGQYSLANEMINQSIELHRRMGNELGEAESRISFANMLLSKGDYSRAIENYSSCLCAFRTFSDLKGEGAACHGLGHVYNLIGQYDRALEMLNRSLHVSKQIGDLAMEGASLQVCWTDLTFALARILMQ